MTPETKESIKLGIISFFILFFLLSALFLLIGCQSAPDKKDFSIQECFYAADCMYRNQKNPDKSACAEHAKNCSDASKEERALFRLKFCEENKFNGLNSNECRMFLNQK
jgi:hypothetical protein